MFNGIRYAHLSDALPIGKLVCPICVVANDLTADGLIFDKICATDDIEMIPGNMISCTDFMENNLR